MIDVGLLNALKKLPRVGAQRFDIAALPFGIHGVKRERAFAGAGDAAHHRERIVRNIDIDILQVVRSRTADGDEVIRSRIRCQLLQEFVVEYLFGHRHSLLWREVPAASNRRPLIFLSGKNQLAKSEEKAQTLGIG